MQRADDVMVAYPLFQEECGGSIPTSALQLKFGKISTKQAVNINERFHSRLPKISNAFGAVVCYGAEFDNVWYASAIWGVPVARKLNGRNWLELRRMAISDNAPPNTATRMIGWMVRDIKKRFPQIVNLISYQDTDVHRGTIYKASGWERVMESPGGEWGSGGSRFQNVGQATGVKVRWEKRIKENNA